MDEHSAGTVADPVTTDDVASAAGGDPSPVVADDLFQMRYATNARIAADGRFVAFVRTSVAPAGDGYLSEICRVEVSDGQSDLLGTGTLPRFWPGSRELAWASGDQNPAVLPLRCPAGAPPGPYPRAGLVAGR